MNRSKWSRRCGFASFLLLCVLCVQVIETKASESYETIFTYKGEDYLRRIQDKIVENLKLAKPGSEVLASFRHIKSMRITNEMERAFNRGVEVKVILSYKSRNHSSATGLKAFLGSNLIICGSGTEHKGCMSSDDNLNTFILFSELNNGLSNVVIQTSQELYVTGKYENALVVNDDSALYLAYKNYWSDLSRKEYTRTSYNIENGSNGAVLYMGTRQSDSDIYASILNQIACSDATESSFSTIFIAMKYFTSARPKVIEKILEKSSQKCNINIVVNKDDSFDRNSTLARSLVNSGVRVWLVPNVSSSYVALNGFYGSNPVRREMVWTGSHTFSLSSLKNSDSSFVRVVDANVYSSYRNNWFLLMRTSESYRIYKDQKDIVTWNLLAEGAEKNGFLPWAVRKESVIEKLLETDADVIGLQEVNSAWNQLSDLVAGLSDKYNYCGGKVLNWYAITNPIFIKKGLSYSCTNGYYHLRSGGYNCNSAVIDGKDFYNCHFDWRGNENYTTTVNFLERTSGEDYVAMGDFNFSIYHTRVENIMSAELFAQSVNYFPYKEYNFKLVDKIGVPKTGDSCSVRESIDWKSRATNISDHRLTKSTVFTCR